VSDAPTPAPVVAAEAPAPAAPAAAPAPVVSRAKGALAAFRAKAAQAPAAPATPAAPGASAAEPASAVIPPDVADAAKRWKAHAKAESDRIAAAAEGLDEADKALIAGEPDLARKAALLARLSPAADAGPPKAKAAPRAAGAPPAASSIDFAASMKDPRAMAEAKARDPKGFAAFLSSALTRGSGRKSTLDAAPKRA
jgi:pyruvate dehydrogenase E2 component (dihydrolipoamide acetyltransferase)